MEYGAFCECLVCDCPSVVTGLRMAWSFTCGNDPYSFQETLTKYISIELKINARESDREGVTRQDFAACTILCFLR